jgi:hypothetical protein
LESEVWRGISGRDSFGEKKFDKETQKGKNGFRTNIKITKPLVKIEHFSLDMDMSESWSQLEDRRPGHSSTDLTGELLDILLRADTHELAQYLLLHPPERVNLEQEGENPGIIVLCNIQPTQVVYST